jgi:SAM-dependent methyltransferase
MTLPATVLLGLALVLSGWHPGIGARSGTVEVTTQTPAPGSPPKRPDAPQLAPYVPTPQDVVDRMLKLAGVSKNDVVLDLGCGDGRIPIAAARSYGARGIGVDIDPQRIAEANANAKAAGVTDRVIFKLEDAMTTDLSQATVVTLYLLSSSNLKLRPILTRQLKPGTRIIAHNFAMGDWEAEKVDTFQDKEGRTRTLYRWTTDGRVRQ